MRTSWKQKLAAVSTLATMCAATVGTSVSTVSAAAPTDLPLLQKSNLTYVGAFRVPPAATDEAGFAYGGTSIAFNPEHQSLYMVGHDWHQLVGELKIPDIKSSAAVSGIATATLIQPLTDASEGKMYSVGPNTVKIGGLLPYQGKLYGSAYLYYDGEGSQVLSHFVTSPDLSKKGDVSGMYKIGTMGAGFVSGYMAQIPAEWQDSFGGPALTGNCCLGVISRTSYGPAVSVFNPADLGQKNPIPNIPLVYYTEDHHTLGAWNGDVSTFNGTTEIRGLVFPNNTRSVLFIGDQGIGKFCYGPGSDCHDPASDSKGVHGYPYAYQIWAYDALDLLAVKNGQKQPWDVKPYAVWNFDLPYSGPNDKNEIGGAAYDPSTNRIFVSQKYGDGAQPVVHVFKLQGVDTTATPGTTVTPPAVTPSPTPAPTPTPTPIVISPVTPSPSPVLPAPVAPISANTQCSGLTGVYFNNKNFSRRVMTVTDQIIHFHWNDTAPSSQMNPENFSVRWTGYIRPAYSEVYTFSTIADDGVRLWVNGKRIINNWTRHAATENSGQITLKAGKAYKIQLDYFEQTGNAEVELLWSSPSQPKQTIPSTSLFPTERCTK